MDTLDALTAQAHTLVTSARCSDLPFSVTLARSLHTTAPVVPADVRAHLDDAPQALAALARHAQSGDCHALLMAAVLMRDRLRTIACLAGDQDGTDTLTAFWTLIRTASEPDTLTAQSVSYLLSKRLHAASRSAPVVIEPHDPHATIFDQALTEPDRHTQAVQLIDAARAHHVITALEYQTLAVLYLQGTGSLTVAAQALHATTSAVERRAQRAIRKLTEHYRDSRQAAA